LRRRKKVQPQSWSTGL